MTDCTKPDAQAMRDYHTAFDDIERTCEDLKNKGVSLGVVSVVLVRMSAILCRWNGIDNKDFTAFAEQHYKMIIKSCDEAEAEDKEELN